MAWFKKTRKPIETPDKASRVPEGLWVKCPECGRALYHKDLEASLQVCQHCGHHFRMSSHERLRMLFDDASWTEHDAGLRSIDPLKFTDTKAYRDRLASTIKATGLNDAVVVGTGTIEGLPVVICAMEYSFIGGSMGVVVGEKITRGAEMALHGRKPLVVVSCSGGARMMEGALSLMQMAKISAALGRLDRASLPYISVLTDPTTGGVTASFAMLGDLNIAEPKALIGFAGPRVIEQTIRQKLPDGFQRSEFLLDKGFIDLIVDRRELRAILAKTLRNMMGQAAPRAEEPVQPTATETVDEVAGYVNVREQLFALEQFGIKLGLDQIHRLLTALQFPERAYPSLTVAGTNGKGSVTAFVEHALRAAGYRTGRYTSPHLGTIEERFAVQGAPVSGAIFEQAATRVMRASAELPSPPSFFEATTALALDLFRELKVDVAVLEVGLGGRLDATTAVDPIAVAITLVDFDHEQYLGHTLEQIAAEKAGVIKPGGLAVVSDNPPEVWSVVADHARRVGAHVVPAMSGTSSVVTMQEGHARLRLVTPHADYGTVTLGLAGRHQVANAITAVRLLEEVDARGWLHVPIEAMKSALRETRWPGRLERLRCQAIDLLLDGAHNPSGARALASYVLESFDRPLPMVIGVMQDKDLPAMVDSLAPAASHFVLTAASSPRACRPAELETVAGERAPHIPRLVITPPRKAVEVASRFGSPVVVAGSLYLVGEIRAQAS